jgi:hypothetical protein
MLTFPRPPVEWGSGSFSKGPAISGAVLQTRVNKEYLQNYGDKIHNILEQIQQQMVNTLHRIVTAVQVDLVSQQSQLFSQAKNILSNYRKHMARAIMCQILQKLTCAKDFINNKLEILVFNSKKKISLFVHSLKIYRKAKSEV